MLDIQPVVENSNFSCRHQDIKKSTANKIINKYKFHSYHIQLMQELSNKDVINRQNFCRRALKKFNKTMTFSITCCSLSVLLFTKMDLWTAIIFNIMLTQIQDNWFHCTISTVSHGMGWHHGEKTAWTYFFNETVNGESFLHFSRALKTFFFSFLWAFVKDPVYQTIVTTRKNMKERIRNVFEEVSREMLQKVSGSFVQRIRR